MVCAARSPTPPNLALHQGACNSLPPTSSDTARYADVISAPSAAAKSRNHETSSCAAMTLHRGARRIPFHRFESVRNRVRSNVRHHQSSPSCFLNRELAAADGFKHSIHLPRRIISNEMD